MNFISLFAGIGGIDLGLERAGMTCVAQVEINERCRRVLAKHWPGVPRFDDVRTFGRESVNGEVDLIAGGFPCQDISVAGRMEGIGGKRSGLWSEYRRIVREFRPRFVFVENVAALANSGLGTVLGDLSSLGFDAEWSVVSACAMGAPHTRDRLFIVAYPREIGRNSPRKHFDGGDELQVRREWEAAKGWRGWGDVERWIGQAVADGGGVVPAAERGGMADGLPDRLDRIGAAGNAVCPAIAEWIGRQIITLDSYAEGRAAA